MSADSSSRSQAAAPEPTPGSERGSTPFGVRRMPAESEPHERTWMAFPPPNHTFGPAGSPTLERAQRVWADVASTIARYEPVSMLAAPGQQDDARALVGPGVEVVPIALDDAWARDIGPTFTVEADGSLGAVDWVFNGWGGQDWASWEDDARVAGVVARLAGTTARSCSLTNEGGGIHVDGDGTVLLTQTVQLDPGRNPGWDAERVEAEIHSQLGTRSAVWLPRGLTRDYDEFGTRGHIDIVATFVRPGLVAVHSQRDPVHPDYPVTRELVELLRESTDAGGRPLEVVEIPAPQVIEVDGQPVDYSYLNHYVGNGFVLVGTFDDPGDAEAVSLLSRLYPGRSVETADGRTIFAHGGGVHCITQQQPRPAEAAA